MSFLALAVAAGAVLCTIEIAAWALVRSLGHVPMREFPHVPRALILKFGSFDPELGHVPIANSETFDRDISGKAYATRCSYNADGARMSMYGPDAPAVASTFGDSFCQCRGVEDDQTWQRRLEELLGGPVRNYGVGGHGLDQAYLRYLRLRASPLGDTILFAVSACTIERIVGLYKHYIEFNNVLGIKPRFRLEGDGILRKGSIPVDSVHELPHLRRHRDYIHAWDENYNGYFRRYGARFPYSLFLLRNRPDFLQAIARPFCSNPASERPLARWAQRTRDLNAEASRQIAYSRKNAYFRDLYMRHEELLIALCRRIGDACREDGRRAVLLMLPDYTNIRFMNKGGHYYRRALDRIAREAGMKVLDSHDVFSDCDPRSMFLKDNASGHHTALGNRILADHVHATLWPAGRPQ